MSRPTEEDLVFDILTLLPVKSLIRFRCVSKSWNSTIISRMFITTHLNLNINRKQPKLLSKTSNNESHNGFMICTFENELCKFVCNNNRTLTEISGQRIPFPRYTSVNFCNGLFCFDSITEEDYSIIRLWNPHIRKSKVVPSPQWIGPFSSLAVGLGYDSQNNDFKILRMVCPRDIYGQQTSWPEAEIYTLSTDSWRKVLIAIESRRWPNLDLDNRCTFFNGALHTIACAAGYKFILSFDVNDERFHETMLPQNYYLGESNVFKYVQLDVFNGSLDVFKGSLALIVFDPHNNICHIWEMKEYGVAESWTQKCIPMDRFCWFYGCTVNGELLFQNANGLVSTFDPESLNENIFAIEATSWKGHTCTANSMESLILLDGE